MITNIEKYILNESFSFTLFCTISSNKLWYWSFTAGQHYKVFNSEKHDDRIKDNNNNFIPLTMFNKKEIIKNGKILFIDYEYGGWDIPCTLTDTRYSNYILRYDSNKFGL